MAWTNYQSKDQTFEFDGIALSGIQNTAYNGQGKPRTEYKDMTKATDGAYVQAADELGGKGSAKTTFVVRTQQSKLDFTESGILTKDPGDSGVVTFYPDGNVLGSDKWTGTLRLQERVTTIVIDAITEMSLTFEADIVGTWSAATGA